MNQFNDENFNTLDLTVFIPNQSGHDFSESHRYGNPKYVTKGLVNRFAVNWQARRWMSCLIRSSPKDYILVSALTILTVVGAAIFGYLHGRINLLLFKNNRYISRTIVFDTLKESIEQSEKEDSYESQ